LSAAHYALIWPQVHVSTKEIFEDPGLTRNTKATKISDFSAAAGWLRIDDGPVPRTAPVLFGSNDLETVARRRFPDIDRVVAHLARFGPTRMTGSGSAVFMVASSEASAHAAVADLPAGWSGWAVRGLTEHPLRAW
jgi:4-diphosphocytidyl-2-C-methyl-D-erythritol kinase